ncbi:serine O-acetyltransferase EpsC [Synechococcus elongatus IITB4]|uniref:serine O-acetyltransferase EpsC n=1 Tax=Synechococcus elongatus TaxID=32046 RepID=UPI0030D336FE
MSLSPRSDRAEIRSGWGLDSIVSALSQASTDPHPHHLLSDQFYPLPSRESLGAILHGLRSVLFPRHFGDPELSAETTHYFIGNTLDKTLNLLNEQIRRELWLQHLTQGTPEAPPAVLSHRASELTQAFAQALPEIKRLLDSDVNAAYLGDPAAQSISEILFCYPGITAITFHRLAHRLYQLGLPLLARITAEVSHSETGIDIHPGAAIGGSFFIDHGTGVVIGETCVIGDRVRIYQAVTLGAKSFPRDETGALIKGQARHPLIEDDVVIYAGATLLGRITVGRGSTIGGNVWLTRSVPSGSFISQAQIRADNFESGGGI